MSVEGIRFLNRMDCMLVLEGRKIRPDALGVIVLMVSDFSIRKEKSIQKVYMHVILSTLQLP